MKNVEKRPLGRPRGFDLDAVLDKALPIFWEKGFEGASFRELTEAMGIAPPSLVAAFGDKRGLFNAVVERYRQTVASLPFKMLDGPGTLADRLTAFYEAVLSNMEGGGHPSGCLITCALSDAAGQDQAAQSCLAAAVAGADEALAAQFMAAGFEPADAHSRAQIAVATMHSISLRARAGATRAELGEMTKAAVALLTASPPGAEPPAARSNPGNGATSTRSGSRPSTVSRPRGQ